VSRKSILIIEDEPQIRRLVRNAFADEGDVLEAETGQQGIDLAAARRPSLIILDLGLPDIPGSKVCREIRQWSTIPIIVLSAHHADSEKIALLDAGADDYMVKPFNTDELKARARAQLRRAALAEAPAGDGPLDLGGLVVDTARRTIARAGRPIHLTPTEWDLLRAFLRHAGRTLTHHQIFREVWGNAAGDAQSYLRVHIANLRRKIEPDPLRPTLIITEPGVGYRLEGGR
jgi:two-component system KDP operon response regulator KdpE